MGEKGGGLGGENPRNCCWLVSFCKALKRFCLYNPPHTRYYPCYPHCTGEEVEAQRGCMLAQGCGGKQRVGLGHESRPRTCALRPCSSFLP